MFILWLEDMVVGSGFSIVGALRALVLIAGVVLPGYPVSADVAVQAASAESRGVKEDLDSSSDESTGQAANAERLLRLEDAIRIDRGRLAQLHQDFKQRTELFDDLDKRQQRLDTELAGNQQELDRRRSAGESVAGSKLEAEIEKLEQRRALIKEQSENTFQGARTLQVQVKALEEKIRKDQNAIDELTGTWPDEQGEAPVSDAAATTGPTESTGTATLPPLVPGLPSQPATPVERPAAAAPGTAEQMEARRDEEKSVVEAQQAERAVVGFLERKAALEEQIELEQTMLSRAIESRSSSDSGLRKLRDQLQQENSSGASQAEIQATQQDIHALQEFLHTTVQEIDDRQQVLDSLHTRLEKLQKDQLQLTREAEDKRLEADAARKKVIWLESPLHPENLRTWLTTRGPRILLVIGVSGLLLFVLRLSVRPVARTMVRQARGERAVGTNRADTLALSFRSAASALVVIMTILLVFQEAGVDIKTVLGGAAILGVAVAFGAQNLMRDYFTGFLILFEDQFVLGDLISIGTITGTVEKVNMRTTMLRDLEGRVHFIPNGEIKAVTNRTYVWGRAVIEVPVAYKENVDRVMAVLLEVAEEFRSDPEFVDSITDEPVMLGVDRFTDYGVVIKFMMKTKPDQMFPVRRQMLRRIKNKFDEVGIAISVPHRVIHQE